MTDREAFIRAVCAEPDEDTPRLAFADLLDEEGEGERAAFIRSQVECHARGECLEEWGEVLARHDWFPGIPNGALCTDPAGWKLDEPAPGSGDRRRDPAAVARALVTRGFVSAVSCTFRAYRARAVELFAAHPITLVRLTDKWPATIDPTGLPAHLRPPGTCSWNSDATPGHSLVLHPVLPRAWIEDMARYAVGKLGRGFPARWFDAPADAQAALSEWCVALGRQAALTGDPP